MGAPLYWRVTEVPVITLIFGEFNVFAISQRFGWNSPCRLALVYSSKLLFYSTFVWFLNSCCSPKIRVSTAFLTASTQKPIHLLWGEYDIQVQGDGPISAPNSVSSPREVTKPGSYNMVDAIPTYGVLAELSGTNPTFWAIHWMPGIWLRVRTRVIQVQSCHLHPESKFLLSGQERLQNTITSTSNVVHQILPLQ